MPPSACGSAVRDAGTGRLADLPVAFPPSIVPALGSAQKGRLVEKVLRSLITPPPKLDTKEKANGRDYK